MLLNRQQLTYGQRLETSAVSWACEFLAGVYQAEEAHAAVSWSVNASLQNWNVFMKLALPGMLMVCLEWWCFEVGTFLAGTLSTADLGAQSVIFYLETMCFQIPTGVSIAASIRVGQFLGAGESSSARVACTVSYYAVGVYGITTAIIFSTLRNEIPKLFSSDSAVVHKAAEILPILAPYCFLEALCGASAGVLRGCGRQVVCAVVIFFAYYFVAMPLGLPLLLLTPLTVTGLWLGYAAGILLECIGFCFLVATTNWELEAEQARIRTCIDASDSCDDGRLEGGRDGTSITSSIEEDQEGKHEVRNQERQQLLDPSQRPIAFAPNYQGDDTTGSPRMCPQINCSFDNINQFKL
ncbi:Multidrug and toxin extrusion protein 2 [Lamellibrachia satsuma]|nr:Multidrug and toxin extrusion protein 2 [Lamellibrachia satsuma]